MVVQISQIVASLHTLQKGKFLSCHEKNPKEECKTITLRSGKELNKSMVIDEYEPTQEEIEPDLKESVEKEKLALKDKEDKS